MLARLFAFARVLSWPMIALVIALIPGRALARTASVGEPLRLDVPGGPEAFYYRPNGRGMRPVILYLHGRGGNPAEDCRKWAQVATQFGWVVCPQGPEDRGGGARAWRNDAAGGKRIVDATIAALRAKYKRRVQLRGNVLVGFSEGAFVAMQLGVEDPVTWNRWLILAANDQYWFDPTIQKLRDNRRKYKRIFLLTGESDEVMPNTLRVGETLKSARITSKVKIVGGMGHEVPGDRMVATYRRPLLWLVTPK